MEINAQGHVQSQRSHKLVPESSVENISERLTFAVPACEASNTLFLPIVISDSAWLLKCTPFFCAVFRLAEDVPYVQFSVIPRTFPCVQFRVVPRTFHQKDTNSVGDD